ncbi:MAG: response regulator, partial [Gallionellaceae bacterium]
LELIHTRFESLSPRQKEVALLLADGLTNAEVAKSLNTSVHTVKAHRAEAMRRMQAYTFADLVGQLQRLRMSMKGDDVKHSTSSRIIVVEDDLWYRDYLTENLNERGYLAIGVADGDEFTAAWLEYPPDLVILDIELGLDKEDGFAIATRLLENSMCGIIIVTSHDEQDDRIKGLSIGVDAYFSKPVNINELALTITNLLRRLR